MKKKYEYYNVIIYFFSFIFLFCFNACNNEEFEVEVELSEKEHLLNLFSPSGEKIADNIDNLKKTTSLIVAEVHGLDISFEITKLDYLPCEKGFIVFVEYITEDGFNGSYAMSKNTKINYSSNNVILKSSNSRLKSGSEESGGSKTTYRCISNGNCSNCSIQGSYNPKTGENTITCSCDECKMEITISK